MLDSYLSIELDRLRDKVSVELVKALVEESCEVARQLISLLEAGTQAIGKGSDVRDMHVFRQLCLFLNSSLELGITISQEPLEDGLLYFLVVFLLEELILEESHRAENEKLAALGAHIERCQRSICGVADRAGG